MKEKIKIGILIRQFDSLTNWEFRIIEKIFLNENLELSLLIKDGRKGSDNPSGLSKRLKRLIKSKKILATVILKLQEFIESKLFFKSFTVDKNSLINRLKSIEVIELKPSRKGFLDIFSKKDSQIVKSYQLDVILRHEFNIIRGEILNSAKYGIWSFHHGDNSINRGGPPGLWEIILGESTIGVTLQQLTPELDGGLIIDKTYYNKHWAFVKSKTMVFEGSVTLLLKNLNLLKHDDYNPKKSLVYFNPLYKTPKLKETVKYVLMFYSKIGIRVYAKINRLIFGVRYNCWTILVGKGNFLNSSLFRLKEVKMPRNVFWADPFIYNHKGENYIFFENYSYKTKIGKISCGKIKGNQLEEISDVLNLGYHMSYPFIFEDEGEIYLMPETSVKKRLEIYKCIKFPNVWELYSTAFEGEIVADAHIYNDDDNHKWLFINKTDNVNYSLNNELYIYKIDSLKFNKIEGHRQNPVIINSKTARNGGSIFKYENDSYRPSQANIDGVYGRGLNINKIEKLTIDEYIEKNIITAYPNFKKNLISMHHLDQKEDLFVIDAAHIKK
jgi:hypothetical protein